MKKNLFFFILSLVANGFIIFICVANHGNSLRLLNDGDESYYLGLPGAALSGKYPEFYYYETVQRSFVQIVTRVPASFSDYFVAYIIRPLVANPVLLGTFLDVVCAWLILVFSYKFFNFILKDRFLSYSAAIFFVFSPFLYVEVLGLFSDNLEFFANEYFKFFGYYTNITLPVQRGIYTQVSLFVFCLAMSFFVEGVLGQNKRRVLASSFLFGILIYIYPFSWIFASVFSFLFLLLFVFLSKDFSNQLKFIFKYFVLLFSLISIPGLLIAADVGQNYYLIEDLPKVLFLQPFSLLFLLFEIIVLFRQKKGGEDSVLTLVIIALLLSEFVLLNLEILHITKYTLWHPTILFLNPLLGTVLFFQIISYLHEIDLFQVVVKALIVVVFLSSFNITCFKPLSNENDKDFIELIEYVKNNTAEDVVFVVAPFYKNLLIEYRQMPNTFTLLTKRNILSQYLVTPNKNNFFDTTWRELYSHYLFYKELSLYDDCAKILNLKLKKETRLYSLPYRINFETRKKQCEYTSNLNIQDKEKLLVELQNKYKVDYLILEEGVNSEILKVRSDIVWKSENSKFVIIKP